MIRGPGAIRAVCGTEGDWSEQAASQSAYLAVRTVHGGALQERLRIAARRTPPAALLCFALHIKHYIIRKLCI